MTDDVQCFDDRKAEITEHLKVITNGLIEMAKADWQLQVKQLSLFNNL